MDMFPSVPDQRAKPPTQWKNTYYKTNDKGNYTTRATIPYKVWIGAMLEQVAVKAVNEFYSKKGTKAGRLMRATDAVCKEFPGINFAFYGDVYLLVERIWTSKAGSTVKKTAKPRKKRKMSEDPEKTQEYEPTL